MNKKLRPVEINYLGDDDNSIQFTVGTWQPDEKELELSEEDLEIIEEDILNNMGCG